MDDQKLVDMAIFHACLQIRQMVIEKSAAQYNIGTFTEYKKAESDIESAIGYAIRDLYTMARIENPSPYYKDMADRCVNFAIKYTNWNATDIKESSEILVNKYSTKDSRQPSNN